MIWMMGQCAPVTDLQILQDREEWLIHQRVDTPDPSAIQRDLNRFLKWTNRTIIKFWKGKLKLLHMELHGTNTGWELTGCEDTLQTRTYFFTVGVFRHQHRLQRLWRLQSCCYLKPDWTPSWTTYSSWFCFEQACWIRWSLETPSNLN